MIVLTIANMSSKLSSKQISQTAEGVWIAGEKICCGCAFPHMRIKFPR